MHPFPEWWNKTIRKNQKDPPSFLLDPSPKIVLKRSSNSDKRKPLEEEKQEWGKNSIARHGQ